MALSSPPIAPVAWTFRHRVSGSVCEVTSRTWFDARRQAMAILGGGPEEVEMVEREDDPR